jgi:pimeloyl-ACP methyl ester carboxylesterase
VSPRHAPLTLQAVTVAGYPGVEVRPERMTSLPPILWLHGVTNVPEYAAPFLLEFARMGFPALALARRGRLGVPPRDPRSISFDDYLEDTTRVFDATRGEAVVLGHSQGGLLALKLAERRRPPAVVLLAPLPPRGILAAAPRLETLPASLSSLAGILAGARFQPTLRQATALFLNNVPRHLRPEVYRQGVPDSGRALRVAYFPGVPVDPGRVAGPLLCVSGGLDRTIPAAAVARVARRYGGSWLNFEDCGHEFLHEPQGPKVAREIGAWIKARLQERGSG